MHVIISAVSSARCPSGICRHAANLASSLASTRKVSRVTLLVGSWQVSYFRQAFNVAESRLELREASVDNTAYARNLWYYRSLPKLARDLGADITHLSFPAPISRRRFSCPVICSLHDLYPYDVPANFGSLRVLFNRSFLRRCLTQSDVVVCSSDFTRNRLSIFVPKLPPSKATRIYQSVSLDPASAQPSGRLQLRSRPFLLTVAQHRRNKNLTLLLSAFAALQRRDDSFRELQLLVVGAEGPETNTLHGMVKQHSLGDHVLFLSSLPDTELCWLYERAALIVLPSIIEGFCLPLAEALRCGGNVLCSDIPILREVGGSHCRYFSLDAPDVVTELANSIADALRSRRQQPIAPHRFEPKEITSQYVALYRSLISNTSQIRVNEHADEETLRSEKYAV